MHQMFLDADLEVITAVGRYFKTGHKKSGAVVDAFIKSRSHLLMHHEGHLPLNTGKGTHHDLHVIQAALNRIYFNGWVELDIQWGSPRRHQKRRRSIQLGSYDARIERITIHPALDKSFIPEICVARVVHHEMCHHVHPAQRSPSGRRLVHHAEFPEAERHLWVLRKPTRGSTATSTASCVAPKEVTRLHPRLALVAFGCLRIRRLYVADQTYRRRSFVSSFVGYRIADVRRGRPRRSGRHDRVGQSARRTSERRPLF